MLSPGMMPTDLLMDGNRDPKLYRIFNILAEKPDVVARWIVPKVRSNTGTGKNFAYMTKTSVCCSFMCACCKRNRLINETTGELMYNSISYKQKIN